MQMFVQKIEPTVESGNFLWQNFFLSNSKPREKAAPTGWRWYRQMNQQAIHVVYIFVRCTVHPPARTADSNLGYVN